MLFPFLKTTVTRARPTSNTSYSAAAIAVVSEVNPDKPGASSFFPGFLLKPSITTLIKTLGAITLMTTLNINAQAYSGMHTQNALNTAVYNNTLLHVTPMMFHRLELGMTYDGVTRIVGKSPFYCDSGESACNAEYGTVSRNCLQTEFIHPNKNWICHWDGERSQQASASLDVWFVGSRVSQVAATLTNGDIYRRDSGNTIHLDRRASH